MRVVFFGTPQISADVLFHLLESNVEVVGIVTMPDRPKGRSKQPVPPPVKVLALQENLSIPILQFEKTSIPACINALKELNPDLFIVIGFGEILKPEILSIPHLGAVNIHVSLLPKYRGAAPIARAIMAGEKRMGVTIMKMNPVMDAGGIISQASYDMPETWDFPDIERKICELAKTEIVKVLRQFKNGEVHTIEQDVSEVTMAPKIKPDDCHIDWSWDAKKVCNLVRALTPRPAAVTMVELAGINKKMKVYKAKCVEGSGEPGAVIVWTKSQLVVAAGNGAVEICELQLEGKGRITSAQFYAGHGGKSLKFFHFLS